MDGVPVFFNLPLFCYRELCDDRPNTSFFLAPTTMRTSPEWFSSLQTQIGGLIYEEIHDQRPRLSPLPAFMMDRTFLDSDGVHFTPVAGRDYVLHLIDKARCIYFLFF